MRLRTLCVVALALCAFGFDKPQSKASDVAASWGWSNGAAVSIAPAPHVAPPPSATAPLPLATGRNCTTCEQCDCNDVTNCGKCLGVKLSFKVPQKSESVQLVAGQNCGPNGCAIRSGGQVQQGQVFQQSNYAQSSYYASQSQGAVFGGGHGGPIRNFFGGIAERVHERRQNRQSGFGGGCCR